MVYTFGMKLLSLGILLGATTIGFAQQIPQLPPAIAPSHLASAIQPPSNLQAPKQAPVLGQSKLTASALASSANKQSNLNTAGPQRNVLPASNLPWSYQRPGIIYNYPVQK